MGHIGSGGDRSEVDEVYTSDFLSCINGFSDRVSEKNDYVNEFFLYFIIPHLERQRQPAHQETEATSAWLNIRRVLISLPLFIYFLFCSLFYVFILPFYVLVKYKKVPFSVEEFQSLAVIRSPASCSKMLFLKSDGVRFYVDSLVYNLPEGGYSIYSQDVIVRFLGLLFVPLIGGRDVLYLFWMACKHLGFISAVSVLGYYRKRIAHKAAFEFYLKMLLSTIRPEVLYTGNKEDRFAMVEKRLCANLAIQTICVPHGLEYSFKMPGGLVGETFYCNSQYSKLYLDDLYQDFDNFFIFDESVVGKMLSRSRPFSLKKKLVFFPESRELEKNVVIIEFLKKFGAEFFVKLHIKDALSNYRGLIEKSQVINDFDEAISNSICLARKSTVLLEAIYNNSIPVAVLVDPKDRAYFEFMFPSLRDENIRKVFSFCELNELFDVLEVKNV